MADCSGSGLRHIPNSLPVDTDWLLLSQNNISKLSAPSEETTRILSHISKLDLSRNDIKDLPEDFLEVFITNNKLLILNVSNNNLVSLPQNIKNLTFVDKISISNNNLKCSCNNFWLKYWILNETGLVEDYKNVKCQMPSGKLIPVVQMDKADLQCVTVEEDSFPLWKIAGEFTV